MALYMACVIIDCVKQGGNCNNIQSLELPFVSWRVLNKIDRYLISPKSIKHTKTANQSTPQGSLQHEQQELHLTYMNPNQ